MEKFRRNLIELFNGNELPFDAKYYIFKDVYRDIFDLYNGMLEEAELAQQQEMASALAESETIPVAEGTEVE